MGSAVTPAACPTGMPPIGVPPTVVVGARTTSAPKAPLGRNPTGLPLVPDSKALTGRVKLVAGIPPPPRAAPPPPAPTSVAAADIPPAAEAAEAPGAAPPMPSAPGLANMPTIDCSGCIALIGACISPDGACSACGAACITACIGCMNVLS